MLKLIDLLKKRRNDVLAEQMHGKPEKLSAACARELDLWRVQEVLGGDGEQWTSLYQDSYRIVLWAAAYSDPQRLLLSQDYREITDEAFARCYAHLARYQGLSRFSTWVAAYAKNLVRNRCAREQTRKRKQGVLEQAVELGISRWDPLRILLRLERDRCLWRAFFDLPMTEQQIVSLRLFENETYPAIAEELGLSRKEVRRRYQAALGQLRRGFLHDDIYGRP